MTFLKRGQRILHRWRRKILFNFHWISDEHVKANVEEPEDEGSGDGLKSYYTSPHKLRKFVDDTNEKNPDWVVSTGDIINGSPGGVEDVNYYLDIVNNINTEMDYAVGNHDIDKLTRDELANLVGYGEHTKNADSKFNFTFTKKENSKYPIRIIMIDSTHGSTAYAGQCNENTRNWIESILNSCEEKYVLMFMHQQPHRYWTDSFVESDAYDLSDLVENYVDSRNLNVSCFFGHRHGNAEVWTHNNLGSHFLGYMCTALSDWEENWWWECQLRRDGRINFIAHNVSYPYYWN